MASYDPWSTWRSGDVSGDESGTEESYKYSVPELTYADDDDDYLSDTPPDFMPSKSMSRKWKKHERWEYLSVEKVRIGKDQTTSKSMSRKMKSYDSSDISEEEDQHIFDANSPTEELRANNLKRGYVLVIINHEFPESSYDLRKGNEIQEIKALFPDYGYEVRSFTNKNPKFILTAVHWYASKEDSMSFVCFLSSHGNTTSLLCADGNSVRIKDIFDAANTEELSEHPKTFFIDACRSAQVKKVEDVHCPDPPADCFFVGFSCLASKTSRTAKNSCGLYFQTLIGVFRESFKLSPTSKDKRRDIKYLVEKTGARVKRKLQREKKEPQVPEMRSTLGGEYFLQGKRK